jgi:peptide/nickel transport system substrate-binding protein
MSHKSRLALVTLVVLFAMVAALFVPANSPVKAQGKTLTVAFSQEPNTLSPYYTQSAFATWATYLIQAHFFDYDDKFKPLPKLAAEIPSQENGGISKDGKTYTLKLKPNLKWSDGKPLTADDFAFTFEMIKDKANTISQFTSLVPILDTIKVVNPTTITVTFKEPQPFAENVVGPGFIILPKHVLGPVYDKDKTLDNAEENNKPTVFSGPYILKEWKAGESMTFVANPDYVMGKPKIENLVIKFFSEPQASYAALAAGQLDWIPNLQPADGKQIQDLTKDVTFFSLYGSYREYIVFNLADPATGNLMTPGHEALKDVNVRRAIRLGIDREKLVKQALFGLATVSDSLYDQTEYLDKKIEFVKYDPAAAEKLLDAAGWKKGADGVREKDGKKLEFSYLTTPAAQRKQNQAIIQQDLAKIGVKVNLDNKPASEYFAPYPQGGILATGKYDFGEFANNTVTTNPQNSTVRALMMCAELITEKNQGGQNNGGYCNEKDGVDKLQLTTEQSLDAKERLAAAYKIQEIFTRDVPFVILYNRDDIYAYRTSAFAAKPNIGTGILNMWYDIQNWQLK